MNADILNSRFGMDSRVIFEEDSHGFFKVKIDQEDAFCELYLYGAHITNFTPKTGRNLLWLSQSAIWKAPRAIRGGIPICWPWFGPASDTDLPQHGFARNMLWEVESVSEKKEGSIEIVLFLKENAQTYALWPYHFELRYRVIVSDTLKISLETKNTDTVTMPLNAALHSYFKLASIDHARLLGLEESFYIDQTEANKIKKQIDPVVCEEETDRIYINTTRSCLLEDLIENLTIVIDKEGSSATVVWNPWKDKAMKMVDFDDNGYQRMLCVEALASDKNLEISSGETRILTQKISCL